MKKLKLLLPALLLSLLANSQAGQINQINIISLTVKSVLPGNIDSWMSTPGALIMVAQKVPNPRMVEPRLVIQIRSGGAVICGNNAATAKQVDPFDVRTFNTADLTGFLTNCHELKAGTYTICAQFFNIDKVAISREVCKDFRVEEANVEYAPPTLITPDNEKKFTQQELLGVVMFRWTPLVPKPKEPVTYRLKVWQLMQGQNGTQAMRVNQPIVSKDIDNLTQATVNGILTGPCKPPYLCDFIWNVQALNRSGKPMGNNNGTSEPYTFSATEEKTKGPDNVFPEDNKKFNSTEAGKEIVFRWTALVPKPSTPVTYRLKVWQLMQGQNGTQAMRSNQPIVSKDVDNLTQTPVSGLYTGPCKPPYLCDYIWNVQVVTRDGTPGATSEPTTFNVSEEKSKGPDNVFPDDKKIFTSAEAKRPVTFKWSSISPKPAEPVTYRLRVWQLMQGQSSKEAVKSNKTILDIEGNGTVDALTDGLLRFMETGPCKPPYLCDFVWNVEASTRQPGAVPKIIGTSEPTTFRVAEEKDKCPANVFPEDKKKFNIREAKDAITFRYTPNGPSGSGHYRLRVWQLMQGQNGTQAMRSNQPIVTKDVDNLTEVTVNGIYTGPCKPPYLCDFIWTVEVMSAAGQTGCTSEPTTFSVTEENVKCPANLFPEDKKKLTPEEAKKEMMFRWTALVPKPQEPVTYRMKVWQLMQGQNGSQAMRSNQPIVTKDVDNLTQVSVSGIYTGPCKPPYLCDFIWNVEAISKDGHTTCPGEPTTFSVTEETGKCPANLFPEDKKRLDLEEVKRSITFKWTKTETPGESSAYRLKVWQLMQGQNGTQAMKSNTPLVTKEVRNVTEATVNGILTGPCKPPYLCDFIWAVEKINASGQVTCSSQPTMFFVTQYIIQLDSIKVSCTAKPGVYTFKYCITNPNAGAAKLITFTATSSVPAGASISTFTPPLNTTINSNGQLCITGTINAASNLSNICIGAAIQDVANNFWQAQKDTCVKVEPCRCDACDEKNFVMNLPKPAQINWSNNTLSFNQSITITTTPPKTIKTIKAELVYYEMIPQIDDCLPCDKDASLYGHFTNGTNNQQWTGSQTSLSINISTPNVPCCSTLFKWCIRYKVEFTDCTVCSKLICYEKKKEGCVLTGGGVGNPNNNNPK